MILAMIPSCKGQDFAILGQNSQNLCAKIARNSKILTVCIFVGELAQKFAPLYFIALLNTLDMLQSCIGQDFTILRQNSQNLCKIYNKLENIIRVHVWR